MSLVWDDVTYPTTWIINITLEARNDMQVQVRNVNRKLYSTQLLNKLGIHLVLNILLVR